ncbi:hypothetical protein QJQ45_028838, partial [Haematococcus lacustris]
AQHVAQFMTGAYQAPPPTQPAAPDPSDHTNPDPEPPQQQRVQQAQQRHQGPGLGSCAVGALAALEAVKRVLEAQQQLLTQPSEAAVAQLVGVVGECRPGLMAAELSLLGAGEMNWWPEAFPCRAAFAAIGLGNSRIHPRCWQCGALQQPGGYPQVQATPQPCGAQCRGSMPLEPMPMLLDKEAARQAALNAECIRLVVLDTPGMPQFDTLNKGLLKAWCKHNNIRGVSSKSKNELRDMCLLKFRKKVEAPRHM